MRCLVAELGIGGAAARRKSGDANLVEDFVRLKRSGEQVNEEVVDAYSAVVAGGACNQFDIERDGDCRHVSGRVGVGERATKRAHVADLLVRHLSGCVSQDRGAALHQVRALQVGVCGHSAYCQSAAVRLADVGHAFNLAKVDEYARLGKAQLHQGDQAVPARKELCFVAVFSQ